MLTLVHPVAIKPRYSCSQKSLSDLTTGAKRFPPLSKVSLTQIWSQVVVVNTVCRKLENLVRILQCRQGELSLVSDIIAPQIHRTYLNLEDLLQASCQFLLLPSLFPQFQGCSAFVPEHTRRKGKSLTILEGLNSHLSIPPPKVNFCIIRINWHDYLHLDDFQYQRKKNKYLAYFCMSIKLTINPCQNKENDYLLPGHIPTFTFPASGSNFPAIFEKQF